MNSRLCFRNSSRLDSCAEMADGMLNQNIKKDTQGNPSPKSMAPQFSWEWFMDTIVPQIQSHLSLFQYSLIAIKYFTSNPILIISESIERTFLQLFLHLFHHKRGLLSVFVVAQEKSVIMILWLLHKIITPINLQSTFNQRVQLLNIHHNIMS